MKMIIKAKYANGVLAPSFPLDIEEGAEVTLSVEVNPELPQKGSPEKTEEHPDNGAIDYDYNSDPRDFQDIILEIASKIPKEELEAFPPDFSVNLDYYLYGTPKKTDRWALEDAQAERERGNQ